MQFHQFEFRKHQSLESFLSSQELEELSSDFGSVSLERNDISVLKLSFLPHKDGPHTLKVIYQWSNSFEEVIGKDLIEHFNTSQLLWLTDSNSSMASSSVAPSFWNLFTTESFKQIVKFTFNAYFNHGDAEQLEIMELQTSDVKPKKCWVKWKMTNYPLIELPESIMIAVRPLSIVYQ
jgi:hypothetical protein